MQYFIKSGGKRSGPFTIEQLEQEPLTRNSLVWFQGQKDWKKLKDIPELSSIYNTIPPSGKSRKKWLWISLVSLIIIAGTVYAFFFYDQKPQPLTTEQLYQQYSKSVALIKHAFLYKIHIGDKDYYFKEYDRSTGEISELLELEEAEKSPNVSWGTGFFIDDKGKLLTCRHVVDVKPTLEDEKLIFNRFKEKASLALSTLYNNQKEVETEYFKVKNLLDGYGNMMSVYDYDQYSAKKSSLSTQYDELSSKIAFWEYFSKLVNSPDNLVSKTSIQFGIFLNDTVTTSFDDYIRCKSLKVSNDKDVDLAIIQTESQSLPDKSILPVKLDRLTAIENNPIRINEPVRMIGYNDGILIANTSRGIKSQITEGNISQNSDEFKMLYSIPALPGSSGSPIFDQFGALVGVNFAGRINSQSFNYGIQPKKIKAFLDR